MLYCFSYTMQPTHFVQRRSCWYAFLIVCCVAVMRVTGIAAAMTDNDKLTRCIVLLHTMYFYSKTSLPCSSICAKIITVLSLVWAIILIVFRKLFLQKHLWMPVTGGVRVKVGHVNIAKISFLDPNRWMKHILSSLI